MGEQLPLPAPLIHGLNLFQIRVKGISHFKSLYPVQARGGHDPSLPMVRSHAVACPPILQWVSAPLLLNDDSRSAVIMASDE